jgi:hypothetical protein
MSANRKTAWRTNTTRTQPILNNYPPDNQANYSGVGAERIGALRGFGGLATAPLFKLAQDARRQILQIFLGNEVASAQFDHDRSLGLTDGG